MSFKQPKESINKNSPRYQQQLLYYISDIVPSALHVQYTM